MLAKPMIKLLIAGLLWLAAEPSFSMLNPSAVYCHAMGYEYQIAKTRKGETGLCKIPTGRLLNAWDFFLGKVGVDWSYCAVKGLKAKRIENGKICRNCLACELENGKQVPVATLMKLSFSESKCGDGRCTTGESYANCPKDCLSGSPDELCDEKQDGRCDPDCLEQGGKDPDCAGETAGALPTQLVLNADINSTLRTKDGREQNVAGRVSAHLIRRQLKRASLFVVNAFNVVYFNVPQETMSGRKPMNKPTGVLGFSLDMGNKAQTLRYEVQSGEIRGTLRGQIDFPQLYEITGVKSDPKLDDIDVPTQPASIEIRIKPAKAFRQAGKTSANSIHGVNAALDLSIRAKRLDRFDIQGYEIASDEAYSRIEVTWERWWEVAKQLCLQPVSIAREFVITPELGPISIAVSGDGLDFGMPGARTEWNKADITFLVRDWTLVHNEDYMTLEDHEEDDLLAEVDIDDCIEVFFVNRFEPSDNHGGGVTYSGGRASSKIISSDENAGFGIDLTHLAHELGHVMTLKHPGSGYPTAAAPHRVDASAGTLMCASGFKNDNPRRNSLWNLDQASNPLFTYRFKMISDGPDCSHSVNVDTYVDDCGNCP